MNPEGQREDRGRQEEGGAAEVRGNWVDFDETYLLYNFISRNQVNNYLYRLKINN
jgi:hypothetical protein